MQRFIVLEPSSRTNYAVIDQAFGEVLAEYDTKEEAQAHADAAKLSYNQEWETLCRDRAVQQFEHDMIINDLANLQYQLEECRIAGDHEYIPDVEKKLQAAEVAYSEIMRDMHDVNELPF